MYSFYFQTGFFFFLVQISQDAVLYACRFTGTACVPGIIQGPHCHSGLQSIEATAQCSNVSTTTGAQAKRLLRFFPLPQKLPSITNSHNTRENNLFFTLHRDQTHQQTGHGRMLRRFPAPQVSARVQALRTEHRPLPAVPGTRLDNFHHQRRYLEFPSTSAAHIWQPIAGTGSQPQHQARCSQGCIQLPRQRSRLSRRLRGAGGGCWWV